MEGLPADLCLKIFCFLDHHNLAIAQQGHFKVCRRWKILAANNNLWSNLFEERWGRDHAAFYAPVDSKSWKDVYEVQDRCDRIGLGLKIIKEGGDYYLIHQGEIQRHLGSRQHCKASNEGYLGDEPSLGILDKILFFIGDLESASVCAKRSRKV